MTDHNSAASFEVYVVFHPASEPTTVPGIGSYVDRPVFSESGQVAVFATRESAAQFMIGRADRASMFIRPACLVQLLRLL